MKNKFFIAITGLALLEILSSCGAPFNIDRGRVEDLWNMKIISEFHGQQEITMKQINIQPNTFFTLTNLGLKDNYPFSSNEACNPTGYKSLYHSYSVEIQNPEDNRKYYGRIAFFKAKPYASTNAVTSYYRITFPAGKFAQSSDGRVAFYYEYYDHFPTWILWVSDVPLK